MPKHDDDAIFKIIAGIMAMPFLALLRAWVLTILWVWFIGPFGVAALGLAHAYGLAITAQLFVGAGTRAGDDDSIGYAIAKSVAASLLFLGFGAIAHALM